MHTLVFTALSRVKLTTRLWFCVPVFVSWSCAVSVTTQPPLHMLPSVVLYDVHSVSNIFHLSGTGIVWVSMVFKGLAGSHPREKKKELIVFS